MSLEILRELNVYSIVLRIILSTLIGGALGLERERKNRPAGFRTYMLVCLGSALVMMTNQYVFQVFNTSDPVRMGAQVVSGIGFLGAGSILITGKNQVKGITTAAGLWAAACCGLAVGIGFYEGAIIGGVAILVVMALMQKIDGYVLKNSHTREVYIELDSKTSFSEFLAYAREKGIDVFDIQMQKNKMHTDDSVLSIVLTARNKGKSAQGEVISTLSAAPGMHYIEELH